MKLARSLALVFAIATVSAPVAAQFVLRTSTFSMGGQPVSGPGLTLQTTLGIQAAGRGSAEGVDLGSGFVHQVHPPAGPLAAPVANADLVSTDEDTPILIDVLANDLVAGGDSLRIIKLRSGANGSALVVTGGIRYTPKRNFFGADSLGYTVSNLLGGTSSAEVRITVNPVNDAPEFKSPAVTSAVAGVPYRYSVQVEDVDSDAVDILAQVLPPWLTLTDNSDGTASLAGTPDDTHVGDQAVILIADDGIDKQQQSFVIEVAAGGLAPPELVAPENGAVVAVGSIELVWNEVVGAGAYDVQVDDNADFTSPVEGNGVTETRVELTGLTDGVTVFWRVRAVNTDGAGPFAAPFHFSVAANVSTEEEVALPTEFVLHPAYPNPFNPTTTIPYDLPKSGHVRLTVYDLFGRVVTRLVDDNRAAGRHSVTFEAGELPSGTYFYLLETPDWHDVRQFVLLK